MAEQQPERLVRIDVDERNKTVTITLPDNLVGCSDIELAQIVGEIERARDEWSARGFTVHAGP